MSYNHAFERLMENEGLWLTNIKDDNGGETFAGITRKWYPDWKGWEYIDNNENPPIELIKNFYKVNFWDMVKGDDLLPCKAFSIFDFAVNVGIGNAVRMAQTVAECKADGILGNKSIDAIEDTPCFLEKYALRKVKYYATLCSKDASQKKFLLGWINRTMEDL